MVMRFVITIFIPIPLNVLQYDGGRNGRPFAFDDPGAGDKFPNPVADGAERLCRYEIGLVQQYDVRIGKLASDGVAHVAVIGPLPHRLGAFRMAIIPPTQE